MIEKMESSNLTPRRAALFREADGDDQRRILSDVEGTVIEFYDFKDEEIKNREVERLYPRGFNSFEVGKTTVFYIDREEDLRRIRENIE